MVITIVGVVEGSPAHVCVDTVFSRCLYAEIRDSLRHLKPVT